MAEKKLLKNIQSTLSMNGLIGTRDVTSFILSFLKTVGNEEQDKALSKIIDEIVNLKLNSKDPHITVDDAKSAIKEFLRPINSLQSNETIFNVINSKDIPRIVWNVEKKKFVIENGNNMILENAENKSAIFRNRLEVLKRITLRNENFTPPSHDERNVEKFELTSVELLKTRSKSGEVYVLGMLSQIIEGKLFIEDKDGTVELDLTQASFPGGLILEGCIVIANGIFEDGILKVEEIGLPPAEVSRESRLLFGSNNTFGGASKESLKLSEKLKIYEQSHDSDMLIILSDVWLDDPEVMKRLNTMLAGYSDGPPVAFIFCGHFLSSQLNSLSAKKLKDCFHDLAKMIKNYPDILKYSKFVFIPGPLDIGAPRILPRSPLPTNILSDFIAAIPGAIFAGNPCRIQYCTKEIVVFREDIITKMSKSALIYPTTGHIWDHYARTIICEAHLSPMNLTMAPVYWNQDHQLQLFPTPDVIIVADEFKSYTTSYKGCQVVNPGPFSRNNFSFLSYTPGDDSIGECEVPADVEF